jgi:hypothetical protein
MLDTRVASPISLRHAATDGMWETAGRTDGVKQERTSYFPRAFCTAV